MVNEGIRVETAHWCLLCGERGTDLYSGFRDRLFDAPGVWGTKRCGRCGLLWLDPRPIAEDIGKLYATYYTHASARPRLSDARSIVKTSVLARCFGYDDLRDGVASRVLGAALSRVASVRDRVGMGVDYLGGQSRGRLLDVGCGSGVFIGRMQQLGWTVMGVDPDPAAAEFARNQLGVPVVHGDVTAIPATVDLFDVVTLNHVIEHALDPAGLLGTCARFVKPGGRLVILTPNTASYGHAEFAQHWMPLEPPRHVFLFSPETLGACAVRAGLQIESVRTSARSAAATWTTSHQIARSGRGVLNIDSSLAFHPRGVWFQLREHRACARGRHVGEELLLVARRPVSTV